MLFLKHFLPLSSSMLPSGEENWYLLLFLEFHLLESWEYCRSQFSVHQIHISSTDRQRKRRKPLWICKKANWNKSQYCKSLFRLPITRFSNLSHGFSAMVSHLWLLLKISAKEEKEENVLWSQVWVLPIRWRNAKWIGASGVHLGLGLAEDVAVVTQPRDSPPQYNADCVSAADGDSQNACQSPEFSMDWSWAGPAGSTGGGQSEWVVIGQSVLLELTQTDPSWLWLSSST